MRSTLALIAALVAVASAGCTTLPSPPAGTGAEITVDPPAGIKAYVDYGATNVRNDPCMVTIETNAGVRVLKTFLEVWEPSTRLVDAGVTLAASTSGNVTCSAVVASNWTGIPGDATDGTIRDRYLHNLNIAFCVKETNNRTAAQALQAYFDDRRNKGYSVSDSFGPLTSLWRAGTGATTTITTMPADSVNVSYSDGGVDLGVTTANGNTKLGLAVDFVAAMSATASSEPAKRFYKYARPFRWSTNVTRVPNLVPVQSSTASTDGGFPSGHTAEAWRDALGFAYVFPERFQEIITRANELAHNRIVAGYHSPFDTIGGRMQDIAIASYSHSLSTTKALINTSRAQVIAYFKNVTGVADEAALYRLAHSETNLSIDRFADHDTNKKNFEFWLRMGMPAVNDTTIAARVPKGAEALLGSRLPYLTAAQRRVVIKSTALPSGYPILDDDEGWGRMNLFAAADGYGAFEGDVYVTMDASLGGFNAADSWRNDISGAGKLVKKGTGLLNLTGNNSFTGGVIVQAGTLVAQNVFALGSGDVYVQGGVLHTAVAGVSVASKLTLLNNATLQVDVRAASQSPVEVASDFYLDDASLHISFPGSYAPAVNSWVSVLSGARRHGTFAHITVDGFSKVHVLYTAAGVQVQLLTKRSC